MFPVYSRVIKAWLASSCAPLLLLHQRPVLFCVCFKKFKHIGLEGGWAGLGWPRASDHLLVLRLLTHGSFHVFQARSLTFIQLLLKKIRGDFLSH